MVTSYSHLHCHIRPCHHKRRHCRDSIAARSGPAATRMTRHPHQRSPAAPSEERLPRRTSPAASVRGDAVDLHANQTCSSHRAALQLYYLSSHNITTTYTDYAHVASLNCSSAALLLMSVVQVEEVCNCSRIVP